MLLTLLAIGVSVLVAYFLYLKVLKNRPKEELVEEGSKTPTPPSPAEQREIKILALVREGRLLGVSQETDFEQLMDKCIEIHQLLSMSEQDDIEKMQSVPADFQRLLDEHLMNFVKKFSRASGGEKQFNETIAQLMSELDKIKVDIEQKNFAEFNQKARFMNIRFSDQF